MKSLYFHHSLDEYLSEGPALTMLDRLELDISAGTASGVKAVSMGEPFFQGHFPGAPIMPGVLQVAAMVQAASVLLQESGETAGANVVLKSLARVKFRKPVLPGTLLAVEVSQTEPGSFQGKTLINGETACSANFVLEAVADMDFPQPEGLVATVEEEKEGEEDGEVVAVLDTEKILATIPHRFPFMFLDGVTTYAHSAIGYKNVSGTDPLLADMIPEYYPGYLQVEASAQAACALVMTRPENAGKLGFFMSIDKAVFHSQVFPGDRLRMHVAMNERGRFGVAEASITVAGRLVTEATMKFAIVDRD